MELRPLLWRHRPEERLHGSHPLGELGDDVVERPGAWEEAAVLREEVVDLVLARLATFEALLEQAVEIADHLAVRIEILGRRALDRLRQAVHEPIERLLAQAFGQLVEPVPCPRLHEVVFLELPDPVPDVAGQSVELVDPAGGGVAEHRPERGVLGRPGLRSVRWAVMRRVGRRAGCWLRTRLGRRSGLRSRRRSGLVQPALDPGPFLGDDLLELLADAGQDVAQLVPLLELVAPEPKSLAEVVQTGQIRARRVARPPATLHQPPECLREIALGHDVVGEGIEDLVGVERRDRLGPVPSGIARGASEQRVAGRRASRGRLEVSRIRRVGRHRPQPRVVTGVNPVIAGRPCRPPSDPC